MADDQVQPTDTQPQPDNITASLQNAIWGEDNTNNNPPQGNGDNTPPPAAAGNEPPKTGDQPTTFDPKEWLKKEFDIEDAAVLKQEREELAKLRETAKTQTPQELKFENEQSKKLHELFREGKIDDAINIIQTQKELEKIAAIEVNKDNAEDVIKMAMKLKHPGLSKQQIDFQYNEEYYAGKEPVQKATETDDEFEERKTEWQQKVERLEMKRTIAATMAKPELEAAKAKLVLPEITAAANQNAAQAPSQEDLAAFKKQQEDFLKDAEAKLKGFTGFSAAVKDKDVDYSVSYSISEDERKQVTEKMAEFSASGFDANSIFADRWLEKDGKTININQMVEDLSLIYGGKKIGEKMASDSAGQRLELYIKEKKNIHVSGTPAGNFEPNNKTTSQQLADTFWNN